MMNLNIPSVFKVVGVGYLVVSILSACGGGKAQGESNRQGDGAGILTASENDKFSMGVLPESLKGGGYIDSVFISKGGSRIYFTHSIYPPNVLNGSSSPDTCVNGTVPALEGQVSAPGVEWNSDLYEVSWTGSSWSEPVNLGPEINSLGMECCVWVNDDETELIFYRGTDLDGDGEDGDLGTTASGNYRSTRASSANPWGTPEPLHGVYGTDSQSASIYRHDIHMVESGNYYLWEKNAEGESRLLFGEQTDGTANNVPIYLDPMLISGSVNEDTQVWVNENETELLYNHRTNAQTELRKMVRANTSEPWSTPQVVPTGGFEDGAGNLIWGEPTLDSTEEFMLFIRFDSTDAECYLPDVMWAEGDTENGFYSPVKLN